MTHTSPKQAMALSFLNGAASGSIHKAYDAYVHPKFRHHNAYYKGDRESLIRGMLENHEKFPAKKFEVKKILEDGDTVVTLSQVAMTGMSQPIAVMHMMRFQDGKIIELWDLGQEIPKDSPNENGMF